jgi:hypothetical protein
MADKNDQTSAPDPQPAPPAPDEATPAREAARQKALADAQAEAEKKRSDETRPGGYYIVNGKAVDSEGNEIKDAK